jgi:hypothetical protein
MLIRGCVHPRFWVMVNMARKDWRRKVTEQVRSG